MSARAEFTGEDKVIMVCVGVIGALTTVALVAMVLAPQSINSIIPVMSGSIVAISSLAARHPPSLPANTTTTTVEPGTALPLPASTSPPAVAADGATVA